MTALPPSPEHAGGESSPAPAPAPAPTPAPAPVAPPIGSSPAIAKAPAARPAAAVAARAPLALVAFGVFGILLGSYAYFWQARDWNSASRLMLTYAIVDRGTVSIDGFETQTNDKALFQGRFYSDKPPGYSLLAVPAYFVLRTGFQFPAHPVGHVAMAHWPADYWVTLATSGVASALAGSLLALLAISLGCGPKRAVLVGLAYGLATPAYAYATLAYGHQLSACALLASFLLLATPLAGRAGPRALAAGFLAALAALIEMPVGLVAAILGILLIVQVAAGRRWPTSALWSFAVGAAGPTLLLLLYNLLAFGSPWDMGYFHHATLRFREVHSAANPLGLQLPELRRAQALLWGRYRGLSFYAPIVMLAPFGWLVLARQKRWAIALVSLSACGAIFLVNLCYPEWTGGWSTGPRLLVPMLPFAMIAVAAFVGWGRTPGTLVALVLVIAGSLHMLMFVGVGARIPETIDDPLHHAVMPLWHGDPLPAWWLGNRFALNVVRVLSPRTVSWLAPDKQWLQLAPLVVGQCLAIAWLLISLRRRPH